MTCCPFFTAILPTKGRPTLSRQVVQSVLSQDFEDFELVVVDNDDDESTKHALSDLIGMDRLKYVRTGGLSMVNNWNEALNHFNGQYLLWADSKTFFYPGAFQALHKSIKENPDVGVYSWKYDFLYDSGEYTKYVKVFDDPACTVSSADVLDSFLKRRMNRNSWATLPRGVCTAISDGALESVRQKFPAPVFEDVSPDLILALKLLTTNSHVHYVDQILSCVASTKVSHGRNFLARNIDTSYLMSARTELVVDKDLPVRSNRLVANLIASDIEKVIKRDPPIWDVYKRYYSASLAREIGTVWGRKGNVYTSDEFRELTTLWGKSPFPYLVLVHRFIRCWAVTNFDRLPRSMRQLLLWCVSNIRGGGASTEIIESSMRPSELVPKLIAKGRSI